MLDLVIVDDEYEIRNGLQNYFPWGELGFVVRGVFANGTDALDFITGNEVDVILTDIKMPGISGLDLIQELIDTKPTLRCVVISGFRDFEYAKRCMALGVKDYIVKPTKYEELKQVFTKIAEELNSIKTTADSTLNQEGSGNKVIGQVKKYITQNLRNASLESAAYHVGLNPYYLSSLFHQQTNEKFYDYLLRIRMETAKDLLIGGPLPIQEISRRTGYMNANSFSRAFRIFYGTSPKEFRNRQHMDTNP